MIYSVPSFIFRKERNSLYIYDIEESYSWLEMRGTGSFSGKTLRYYPNERREIYFEFSLMMRDFEYYFPATVNSQSVPKNFTFDLYAYNSSAVLISSFSVPIYCDVDYNLLNIPKSNFFPNGTSQSIIDSCVLTPPSKFYGDNFTLDFFNNDFDNFMALRWRGISPPAVLPRYFKGLYNVTNQRELAFQINTDTWYNINGLPLDSCFKLFYLIWTSQFGTIRSYNFKVKNAGWANDNIQTVVTQQPYSSQILETKRYIVCYLDDLDAYDYWYYSDILQATDVHFFKNISQICYVRIEGEKKLEYPADDSGEFKTLEFKVWFD